MVFAKVKLLPCLLSGPHRVTADQVSSAAARVRRKAQQLAAATCPGLEDCLIAGV
jgi:hypothetical protein